MEREIIVVGAGPSGSTTATDLAQKGHDVLLIDRQQFPRDKTCGDGIPAGAIEILFSLGMEERIRDAGFYEVTRILLSSPRGYVVEADLKPGKTGAESCVVPRMEFDALIQQHAVDSGVEFCNARVTEPIIEGERVVGVRARINGDVREIRSQVVVAADGVTSVVARALRDDKQEDDHRAVALRTYITDIEEKPHEVEFYLYHEILPGYAWIFPYGEGKANLGLGMRLDKFREIGISLEDMVDIFLEMPEIKKRIKRGGEMNETSIWQLNFGSQPIKKAYHGALLVGDAAGLINPLTGGGIHNGLQSALIASDVIHAALKKKDTSLKQLAVFDGLIDQKMKANMRKSYFIQRSLMRVPLWVDLIVRWGGSNSEVAKIFIDKL